MLPLIHRFIDQAADQNPHHPAFIFQERSLSYGDLVLQANRLANVLIDLGVRPLDRVGIYLTKSMEIPVAIYGILKAGAAYVPIDPSAPLDRVDYMIRDCGITHLVSSPVRKRALHQLLERDTGLKAIVGVDRELLETDPLTCLSWEEVLQADSEDPPVKVTDQDLAYIMYTSGSTGHPKGMMHTHASGASYAHYSAMTYGVGPADRLGNHSHLHFDMSTFEFLTGPSRGATTIIIPNEAMLFPTRLADLVQNEKLTFWYSVPLALIQMLALEDIGNRDWSSLRWILFGGEPFPPKYLRLLMDMLPGARFSNVYGPAEVNQCTYFHVTRESVQGDQPVPLGRVWEGAESRILNGEGQPVRPGEPGELLIRSSTMMQGYWGKPDLTEKSIHIEEPLPGFTKRFYRTGDLVSIDEKGLLAFHGRKDRQVKIRGYRIELDELENIASAFDEVQEAAVVVAEQAGGDKELVAVLLLKEGRNLDSAEARKRFADHLSAYAVPKRIYFPATLPRTSSGKIDRRQLAQEYAETA